MSLMSWSISRQLPKSLYLQGDSMKPLRHTLLIVMLIILAPVNTTSKPFECDAPTWVDLSGPIPQCFPTIGTIATTFGWGVYWGDGASEVVNSETAVGTCAVGWGCVPFYESATPVQTTCNPRVLSVNAGVITSQNIGVFSYQLTSAGHTINTYSCGNCSHGFLDDPNGKQVICAEYPHLNFIRLGGC
jgi:hypothetical protein